MSELFSTAREFLHTHFASTSASDRAKRYRYEHCLRVARIGRFVAERAGLDSDALELGCLLHDIGKYDAEIPVDHGRAGALLVQDFLQNALNAPAGFPDKREMDDETTHDHAEHDPADTLTSPSITADLAAQLIQGVAMHVDGLWNPSPEGTNQNAAGRAYLHFSTEPTILSRSIGDCDNVDRFSTYRVADTLRYVDFMNLETPAQKEFVDNYLAQLTAEREYQCATPTAQELWTANLDFQEQFFKRLGAEL